ncbi:hypothetical protein RBSWK_05916 [Rhodopirellula baltica SWK14]|uniref:Uncharacterized protein n=1 Tax=Rhodopirellula baltica SWK14 TaxID=993516 RepID=L7C805_RHOBT|nr:hypothetical protein RBSWK_05916 [Rhodopirellula baltica SWK14]
MNQFIHLFSVQALDRICQTSLCILVWLRMQRIVNSFGPIFFLKCTKDCFLVGSGPFKPLYFCAAERESS